MKIVTVDGNLIFNSGQVVCFADEMGDKRGVVNSFGHIAFITGEHEHMVEIKVTRFQYAHHLYSSCRFAMEGDAYGCDELCQQASENDLVCFEIAACHQVT